jgi:selenocysteine lyase/cysteine desulfurase
MTEDELESPRRRFLRQVSGGVAATALTLESIKTGLAQSVQQLTGTGKTWRVDEGYWEKIRDQFLLDEGLAYLNTGTLGPTPGPVYEAMVHYWQMMAQNPNENSAILQGRLDMIREKAAQFVGASAGEIAIVRNATEGNNLVCQGIDLKQGDEVLIGTLEHDSNRQPWQLKARRHGVVVKEVPIGTPPKGPEVILTAFQDAITSRTKVISVAHCDTVTGTYVPVKELAKLAHSKGILCFVDGAQALGMVALNLRDLGVDAYITTSHKWLAAPAGSGLLYMSRELHDRIWPNIVTENWGSYKDARKYDRLSRRPWPVVAALEDAIDFQLAIGRQRIEQRMRSLAGYLRSAAAEIPHIRLFTSNDPRLSGGMTSLGLDNVPPARLREHLRQRFDVYVAERAKGDRYPADPNGVEGVRVSSHYYNTFEQMDRVLQALNELARGKT